MSLFTNIIISTILIVCVTCLGIHPHQPILETQTRPPSFSNNHNSDTKYAPTLVYKDFNSETKVVNTHPSQSWKYRKVKLTTLLHDTIELYSSIYSTPVLLQPDIMAITEFQDNSMYDKTEYENMNDYQFETLYYTDGKVDVTKVVHNYLPFP